MLSIWVTLASGADFDERSWFLGMLLALGWGYTVPRGSAPGQDAPRLELVLVDDLIGGVSALPALEVRQDVPGPPVEPLDGAIGKSLEGCRPSACMTVEVQVRLRILQKLLLPRNQDASQTAPHLRQHSMCAAGTQGA